MRIEADIDPNTGEERIFTVAEHKIGQHRIVGRDAVGNNVEEKVPALKGGIYLDKSGNELHLALVNGRIVTNSMLEKYMPRRHRYNIRAGFLPRWECPLTEKYSEIVGGPLVAPLQGETACKRVDPETGCEHYQRVKEARLETMRAASRARAEKHTRPTEAMMQLARSIQGQMVGGDIKARRGRIQAGKADADE